MDFLSNLDYLVMFVMNHYFYNTQTVCLNLIQLTSLIKMFSEQFMNSH